MACDFHRLAQDAPNIADRYDVYADEQREQTRFWEDQADYMRRELADCERRVADRQGRAAGLAFRAAELRYDARGGMTAALERRRFEPGARWTIDGEACAVACQDANGLRVDSDRWTDGFFARAAEMTRENGWLFLCLSDLGGYR